MARLDTAASPRLVIIGGSNTAFGLDSRMLADSLGLNVVNTGLHSGIGLRFMLDDAMPRLRPGDKVVVMPEYGEFLEKFYNGHSWDLASAVVYSGIGSLRYLNGEQWLELVQGLPIYLKINTKRMKREPGQYSALNFNSYGDEEAHWEWERMPEVEVDNEAMEGPVSAKVCDEVAEKLQAMRSQGCEVWLLPQISIEKNTRHNAAQIRHMYAIMAERGMPFSLPADSMAVADSLAYDSSNHVTRPGVDISTRRLINFLRQHR